MLPRSLKHTLLLAMAILVIVSGITISQLVMHRYSTSLLNGASEHAENIAHKLALDAADKILINDLVSLQKMLDDQLASDPAVAYIFIVRDGYILTHAFSSGVPVNLIEANTYTDPDSGQLIKIVSERGERYIDIAWPIFSGKAGILRLGLSEEPYRLQVRELWVEMSLITLGILLLVFCIGQLFINRLTRPLLSLTEAAEKIDAGNLEARVDIKGRLEVSKLTASFNNMISRLKEYTSKLEYTNRQLEEKNRELDRAHRQLHTSFHISMEISAIADLKEVCTYLLKKFQSIAECETMALLVFSIEYEMLFVATKDSFTVMDKSDYDDVYTLFQDFQSFSLLEPENFIDISPELASSSRQAVFPLRNNEELLGGLLIGCPKQCRCTSKELDVLDLILRQTAGAIKRATIHEEEIRELRARIETTAEFSGLIGKDPQMQVLYRLIENVAPTDATVLIQGESGTGKELVARAIHQRSDRKDKPFIVINCSAYPSTLLESEIFGHEKGAFTGAVRQKPGRFEQAHGGTVFLDEIGEIPPSAQIKLLRVLQTQKFERVGGEQTLSVDVRILAATNKDLLQEVKNGNFREDLYYRLNVIPIELLPLKKRRNDIPLLSKHFLRRFAADQRKEVQEFSSEAMRLLLDYSWPGNVRELENSIEHAAVLAKGERIEVSDMPPFLRKTDTSVSNVARVTMLENEKMLLEDALDACDWNKKAAAQRLGISRSTLYSKMRKYQITRPTFH